MAQELSALAARLPDATAEELYIASVVDAWIVRLAETLTPEANRDMFEEFFFEHLQTCKGTLQAVDVVQVARLGHPAAAGALRRYIRIAADERQLDAMPTSVIGYLDDVMAQKPMPTRYASNVPQVVDNFARDVAIGWLVPGVKARWPHVPLLYSTAKHHSAAALVGAAFHLSETQTRRIFQARRTMAPHLARFFHGYRNTLHAGVGPNGC